MWRSFFFAVGVMLIILGFECLIADRFEISKSARIPQALARVFDSENTQASGFGQFPASNGSQSVFGPSRFGSPLDSNQSSTGANYYGGYSSSGSQQPNKPFSLAGFGTNQAQYGNQSSRQASLSPGKDSRIVYTKDWMPWSLLAAGTLVVLYTNTTSSRNHAKD